jgi:putative transcriptional regulator
LQKEAKAVDWEPGAIMIDPEHGPSSANNLTGQFLISEAELRDPNFQFTVVIVVNHDDTGALGMVINRPSNSTLGDIFPEQFLDHSASHIPLFVGGPVQQEYIFLIQQGLSEDLRSEGAIRIHGNIYFEPDVRPVLDYIRDQWDELPYDHRPKLRFFAGYSGWAPGQLEEEISAEAWVTHPASGDIIFDPNPAQGWRNALRKKGGIFWIMGETGSKPSMN